MTVESKKIKKAILSLLSQNNEYKSNKKLRKAVKSQLVADSDIKLSKEEFKTVLERLIEKGKVVKNGKTITLACAYSDNADVDVTEAQNHKRKRSSSNTYIHEQQQQQREEDEAQADEDRIINIAHGLIPPINNTNNSSRSSNGSSSVTIKVYDNGPEEPKTATILLFYAYCQPIMTRSEQDNAIAYCYSVLSSNGVTGRLRVGREGFNGTLTGQHDSIRIFTSSLRTKYPAIFGMTDFKYVDHQPSNQLLKNLKVWPVTEIVTYGFDPTLAPLEMTGTHLSPRAFHEAMADPRSVVIDVRNFNETLIGKFAPPVLRNNTTDDDNTNNSKKKSKKNKTTSDGEDNVATSNSSNTSSNTITNSNPSILTSEKVLDPLMRRSTEFPEWVAKNRHKLEGKKVLMYCTGGVRCERASAYIRNLGIEDVSQLEGGIHRYLEAYSEDGGYWVGKNYTFDRRFSHGAEKCDVISHCVHCNQPWDRYQADAKCAICAMEVLLCKTCDRLKPKVKKASLRCPLCVHGYTTAKNIKYLGKGSKIADDG